MATTFPTTLDTTTNLPDVTSTTFQNAAPGHASIHSTANDAIRAIEALLGVNGATDTSSMQGQFYNLANHLSAPLPTVNTSMGAWVLNPLGRTINVMVQTLMTPTTTTAATITIALSTDGGTTSSTISFDNAPANTPQIQRTFRITVPAGWYYRVSQTLSSLSPVSAGVQASTYY